MAGALPVAMLTMLYMALVDPHLVHGCEVSLDEVKAVFEKLEMVQKGYMRRALGLGKYSLVVVLYTETGLEPLGYRRVLLAVGYLLYVLKSECRYDAGGRGTGPTGVPELGSFAEEGAQGELLDEARVVRLEADIRRRMDRYLMAKFESTERLSLLHGRREEDRTGEEVQQVRKKALARMLLSDHWLASRVRRYTGGEAEQQCRFCKGAVENVVHVWLECEGREDLVEMRVGYVRQVLELCSEQEQEKLFELDAAPFQQLRYLVGHAKAVTVTAAYAYEIERLVKAEEAEQGEEEDGHGQ
ncbi:hypothetical protein DFP72DRAFT_1069022 [Ephemerocybe angulata]|uniref:Reverse transcriptase zinc-binding domain-containing protein n=1 Tax=Ephemerocybe angulata TaxID=980116 RepID=A0A8H6HVW5_9AGAR|nr:hypothetical protein DFP72DRAFT_1069022 [Tulosesus angulatus]